MRSVESAWNVSGKHHASSIIASEIGMTSHRFRSMASRYRNGLRFVQNLPNVRRHAWVFFFTVEGRPGSFVSF